MSELDSYTQITGVNGPVAPTGYLGQTAENPAFDSAVNVNNYLPPDESINNPNTEPNNCITHAQIDNVKAAKICNNMGNSCKGFHHRPSGSGTRTCFKSSFYRCKELGNQSTQNADFYAKNDYINNTDDPDNTYCEDCGIYDIAYLNQNPGSLGDNRELIDPSVSYPGCTLPTYDGPGNNYADPSLQMSGGHKWQWWVGQTRASSHRWRDNMYEGSDDPLEIKVLKDDNTLKDVSFKLNFQGCIHDSTTGENVPQSVNETAQYCNELSKHILNHVTNIPGGRFQDYTCKGFQYDSNRPNSEICFMNNVYKCNDKQQVDGSNHYISDEYLNDDSVGNCPIEIPIFDDGSEQNECFDWTSVVGHTINDIINHEQGSDFENCFNYRGSNYSKIGGMNPPTKPIYGSSRGRGALHDSTYDAIPVEDNDYTFDSLNVTISGGCANFNNVEDAIKTCNHITDNPNDDFCNGFTYNRRDDDTSTQGRIQDDAPGKACFYKAFHNCGDTILGDLRLLSSSTFYAKDSYLSNQGALWPTGSSYDGQRICEEQPELSIEQADGTQSQLTDYVGTSTAFADCNTDEGCPDYRGTGYTLFSNTLQLCPNESCSIVNMADDPRSRQIYNIHSPYAFIGISDNTIYNISSDLDNAINIKTNKPNRDGVVSSINNWINHGFNPPNLDQWNQIWPMFSQPVVTSDISSQNLSDYGEYPIFPTPTTDINDNHQVYLSLGLRYPDHRYNIGCSKEGSHPNNIGEAINTCNSMSSCKSFSYQSLDGTQPTDDQPGKACYYSYNYKCSDKHRYSGEGDMNQNPSLFFIKDDYLSDNTDEQHKCYENDLCNYSSDNIKYYKYPNITDFTSREVSPSSEPPINQTLINSTLDSGGTITNMSKVDQHSDTKKYTDDELTSAFEPCDVAPTIEPSTSCVNYANITPDKALEQSMQICNYLNKNSPSKQCNTISHDNLRSCFYSLNDTDVCYYQTPVTTDEDINLYINDELLYNSSNSQVDRSFISKLSSWGGNGNFKSIPNEVINQQTTKNNQCDSDSRHPSRLQFGTCNIENNPILSGTVGPYLYTDSVSCDVARNFIDSGKTIGGNLEYDNQLNINLCQSYNDLQSYKRNETESISNIDYTNQPISGYYDISSEGDERCEESVDITRVCTNGTPWNQTEARNSIESDPDLQGYDSVILSNILTNTGLEFCRSCNRGYHLEVLDSGDQDQGDQDQGDQDQGIVCVPNTCVCPGGNPVVTPPPSSPDQSGPVCETQRGNQCESCNTGYYKTLSNKCVKVKCQENEIPFTEDSSDGPFRISEPDSTDTSLYHETYASEVYSGTFASQIPATRANLKYIFDRKQTTMADGQHLLNVSLDCADADGNDYSRRRDANGDIEYDNPITLTCDLSQVKTVDGSWVSTSSIEDSNDLSGYELDTQDNSLTAKIYFSEMSDGGGISPSSFAQNACISDTTNGQCSRPSELPPGYSLAPRKTLENLPPTTNRSTDWEQENVLPGSLYPETGSTGAQTTSATNWSANPDSGMFNNSLICARGYHPGGPLTDRNHPFLTKCTFDENAPNQPYGFAGCEENECDCPNGIALTGAICDDSDNDCCDFDGSHRCHPNSCEDYYHYNEATKRCDPNECNCPNGQEVGLGQCDVHDAVQCASCNTGYYLDLSDHTCKPITCLAPIVDNINTTLSTPPEGRADGINIAAITINDFPAEGVIHLECNDDHSVNEPGPTISIDDACFSGGEQIGMYTIQNASNCVSNTVHGVCLDAFSDNPAYIRIPDSPNVPSPLSRDETGPWAGGVSYDMGQHYQCNETDGYVYVYESLAAARSRDRSLPVTKCNVENTNFEHDNSCRRIGKTCDHGTATTEGSAPFSTHLGEQNCLSCEPEYKLSSTEPKDCSTLCEPYHFNPRGENETCEPYKCKSVNTSDFDFIAGGAIDTDPDNFFDRQNYRDEQNTNLIYNFEFNSTGSDRYIKYINFKCQGNQVFNRNGNETINNIDISITPDEATATIDYDTRHTVNGQAMNICNHDGTINIYDDPNPLNDVFNRLNSYCISEDILGECSISGDGLPRGYVLDGQPGIVSREVFSTETISDMFSCADGYEGDPVVGKCDYNHAQPDVAEQVIPSGCSEIPSCTPPNPTPGYDLTNVQENTLTIDGFDVTGIQCATGYTEENPGTEPRANVCGATHTAYTLLGCISEDIAGHCHIPEGDLPDGYRFNEGQPPGDRRISRDSTFRSTVNTIFSCADGYVGDTVTVHKCGYNSNPNDLDLTTLDGCDRETVVEEPPTGSCRRPADITGYDLTGVQEYTLTINNFDVTGIQCATGYTEETPGTQPSASACTPANDEYVLSGCVSETVQRPSTETRETVVEEPPTGSCRRPADTTAYDLTHLQDNTLTIDGFNVTGIQCAAGYTLEPGVTEPSATVCDSVGTEYTLSGCVVSETEGPSTGTTETVVKKSDTMESIIAGGVFAAAAVAAIFL